MQTLKLTIPGSYYDSQIYEGRLYLWSNNGSIITIDWDYLIESIEVPPHLKLALTCAFQRSEYLYGNHWKLIFEDIEIKTTIQRKFQELSKSPIEFSEGNLRKFFIKEQNNPLNFPHADCTIYNKTLYVGSQSGVVSARCNKNGANPISSKPNKIWDAPALSINASYLTLAISAGSEGLFEYNLGSDDHFLTRSKPHLVLDQHSNSSRWLYASIFSSSYFNEGFLADFVNEKDSDRTERTQHRKFLELIPSSTIFGHQTHNGISSFTWGLHDKICFANQKSIEVVQYAPYKEPQERFTKLGGVWNKPLEGDIISGDSALFGFIIETEEGLFVINSLMESMRLLGEPVNWRVFPKSKFYTNQLHVIYDDHLCIFSFNEDYFVDQKLKKVGIRRPEEFPWQKN